MTRIIKSAKQIRDSQKIVEGIEITYDDGTTKVLQMPGMSRVRNAAAAENVAINLSLDLVAVLIEQQERIKRLEDHVADVILRAGLTK